MDNAKPNEDLAYWKDKAITAELQKSYFESKTEKLKKKLATAEGELQDVQCDLTHSRHINEFLRLVIADK
jgi:hypothetical protein